MAANQDDDLVLDSRFWIEIDFRQRLRLSDFENRLAEERLRIKLTDVKPAPARIRINPGTADLIVTGRDGRVIRAVEVRAFARGVIGEPTAVSAQPALQILDMWSAILPARVVKEDVGDYFEDLHRLAAEDRRFTLYLRMVAAIFWTGVNAIGYLLTSLRRPIT